MINYKNALVNWEESLSYAGLLHEIEELLIKNPELNFREIGYGDSNELTRLLIEEINPEWLPELQCDMDPYETKRHMLISHNTSNGYELNDDDQEFQQKYLEGMYWPTLEGIFDLYKEYFLIKLAA